MFYAVLAGTLVVIHGLFVAFVVFGGVLVWRWPRVAWVHVPAAVWGVAIEIFGWICPLTPLEQRLWGLAAREGYRGGFVEHYLVPLIYPTGLTRGLQLALGAGVLLLNLAVYGMAIARQRRRRRDEGRGATDGSIDDRR